MWWRRRRRERDKDLYWVDTDALTREQEIEACRAALEFVRPRAHSFQTDVPWTMEDEWPPEVRSAASILAPHHEIYESTGWIKPITDEAWDAYVIFAPFAFSSDVWDSQMKRLADVNDEAYVVVVDIPPDQVEALRRAVAPAIVNSWSR